MTFHKMFEDPMYDEDGNLADEDFEFLSIDELDEDMAQELGLTYDPFETVNS